MSAGVSSPVRQVVDWLGVPPNRWLLLPGAPAGLRDGRLEGSMSRSLTRRFA
jgi:hypothetical protein